MHLSYHVMSRTSRFVQKLFNSCSIVVNWCTLSTCVKDQVYHTFDPSPSNKKQQVALQTLRWIRDSSIYFTIKQRLEPPCIHPLKHVFSIYNQPQQLCLYCNLYYHICMYSPSTDTLLVNRQNIDVALSMAMVHWWVDWLTLLVTHWSYN